MSNSKPWLVRSRLAFRLASSPLLGYPLILCWNKGWIRRPSGEATALLGDGRTLRCDLADTVHRTMWLGLFEPAESHLLAELLKPGDTFIDVGAHIGWFTTIASRRVGQSGQVIAVEPYPQNASALRTNLELNECQNVRVIDAALGSREGKLTLSKGSSSGGVTALEWTTRKGLIEVPMSTLDGLAADIDAVALIKIDVEGWEADVLKGASNTLSRTKYVLIEINETSLTKAKSSADQLVEALRSAGFATFTPITQGGVRRLARNPVFNVLAAR
jgi:FkbM family methyltransferase